MIFFTVFGFGGMISSSILIHIGSCLKFQIILGVFQLQNKKIGMINIRVTLQIQVLSVKNDFWKENFLNCNLKKTNKDTFARISEVISYQDLYGTDDPIKICTSICYKRTHYVSVPIM